MPAPRSQTRIRACFRSRTWTNSVLILRGNAGWFSNFGPSSASGKPSASSTKITQCGFPIETQVIAYVLSSTVIGCAMTGSMPNPRTGIASPASTGSPISTSIAVTSPLSVRIRGTIVPAIVSIVNCSLRMRPQS